MNYATPHSVCKVIRFLRPGRPPDWRRALVMALPLAGLMAVAFRVANEADVTAIESGYFLCAWEMLLFLVVGSAACGLAFGVVETTTYKDLIQTLPWSPLAALIMMIISGLVHAIGTWSISASVIALYSEAHSVRYSDWQESSPPLTPDLWPTGATPRILYEQS